MNHKTIKQEFEAILDDLDDIQEGLCGASQSEYDCLIFREKAYRLAIKLLNRFEKKQLEQMNFIQFVQVALNPKKDWSCPQWIGGNRSYKSNVAFFAKELLER